MKDLSIKARSYILGTIFIGMILLAWSLLRIDWGQIWNLLVLGALASLTLIFKVIGATKRSHYNISFLVYGFTFVLFGWESAILVILISNLVEWAWHRYPWYIQCYNIATYTAAMYLAGLVYIIVSPEKQLFNLIGVTSILLAMGTFTLINHLMIAMVIWLARGENFRESGLFEFFPLMLDFTLLCMGAGTAYIWEMTPFGVVLVLLPLYLIYSTLKVPALERKSEIDQKTGLYNAEYFQEALSGELERANRFNRPLTIVMADLDLLRNINNTYGHLAGDEVLIGVANILKESVREFDLVSRFGGEEYAIMMPETTPGEAYPLIESIREKIEKDEFPVPTSVTPIQATMSFGIAGRDSSEQTPKDLVHNADTALYHAKLKGRNGSFIYSDEGFESLFTPDKSDTSIQEATMLDADAPIRPAETSYMTSSLREPRAVTDVQENGAKNKGNKIKISYPRWLVTAYITTMTAVALALFGLAFHPTSGVDWIGLSMFVLMVVITEWYSIDIYVRNTAVSTSAVPMLAGILLYGPVGAVVLSFTFATVAMIKHRSPPSRFIFNFSNQLIAGMSYTLLMLVMGIVFLSLPTDAQVLLSVAAIGLVYISTTGLIAVGIGLDRDRSIREIWRERFSWLVPYYLAMGLVAYALIFSYQTAGLVGILVVLVPILVLRLSQKQYIDRTKIFVNELKEKNAELEHSSNEIQKLNEGLLNTLAEVVDLRDPYVLGHSKQVAHYGVSIAEKLGLPPKRVELIHNAGLLHDVGKLGISETILFKPGRLTMEEYDIVKKHVTLGADILEASNAFGDLIPIIRHHHERYDGLGYPDGLEGEKIPLEARILSVADSVEAMASDRPYRRGLDNQEVIEELEGCSGTQFDPLVVKVFVEILQNEMQPLVINSARSLDTHEPQPVHVLLTSSSSSD